LSPFTTLTTASANAVSGSALPACATLSQRLPEITPASRRYALKELARRAGVSRAFFATWNIEVKPFETVVSFKEKPTARMRFLHGASAGLVQNLEATIPVARTALPFGFSLGDQAQDLILPFCSASSCRGALYESAADGNLHCRLDLLASIVLTLSRVEESLCAESDEHGRFPASCSVAFRENFLERPILDEHGLAFRQALTSFLPGWAPEPSSLRLKLTHDIDDVGIPFSFRTALSHTLKRHSPSASLRDIFAAGSPALPTELGLVCKLAEISRSRGLHSAFFWKASELTRYDSGYRLDHPKIRRVIESLRSNDFELGVHPGYETFLNSQNLAREVEALKASLGVTFPGGRQHYLRWKPQTWLDWETCGLRYDSSVGFAEQFGFRAGTAFPFRPWCWTEDRELNLVELPLVLMDCTPVKYMRIGLRPGLERIRALVRRLQKTGGVFTLLWHNAPLMDPDYESWYEEVLNLLDGLKPYDLPPTAADLW
jgi:hypothetical protein